MSLGATTFLSKLRSDIDGDLRPQVDVIVDRLMRVTEKDLNQRLTSSKHCVYGNRKHLEGALLSW